MHAAVRLSPEQLAQRWRELAEDPHTPDFYELDEFGELIVSPHPSNQHERIAFLVAKALETQLGPGASTAVSVVTDIGVKRPDAVWMPESRWDEHGREDPFPFVPDICVEVLSPTNTSAEIDMKVAAYLRGGAREVVVVGLSGAVRFFGSEGERSKSLLGIQLALPAKLFR
jgi:Uma2 family endonuclease